VCSSDLSGQCLASSFIGGESGNRGKCTQVCRRKFKYAADNGKTREGYFFSPYDLQAIFVIDSLANSGVSSFKIEGRMKGAEYVSTVVKAYRRAIDNPYETASAARDLRCDFGRTKTSYFLNDRKAPRPIDPSRPSGTGIYAGKIIKRDDLHFTLPAQQSKGFGKDGVIDSEAYELAIEKGDRLRVHPQTGFEGTACNVADCETSGGNIKITLASAIDCNAGDDVFIIGRARTQPNKNWRTDETTQKNFTPYYLDAEYIVKRITPREDEIAVYSKPKLWFKTDTTGWLNYINATPCKHLIFDADMSEIKLLLDLFQKNPYAIDMWRTRMTIALPPFIPESKLDHWRGIVEKFTSMGLQSFTISNIGHFALVNNGQQITADSAISCLNRFTQVELAARNVKQFVYSYEDDYLNIRNTVPPVTYKKMRQKSTYPKEIVGIVPIYGRPPLFISSLEPAVDDNTAVTDPHGNEFFVAAKNGLYYTLPKTPVCLFAKLDRLSECGLADFLIDLSFHEPDYDALYKLMALYKTGTKVEGASIFNFKAGLH
jgi:putative protease